MRKKTKVMRIPSAYAPIKINKEYKMHDTIANISIETNQFSISTFDANGSPLSHICISKMYLDKAVRSFISFVLFFHFRE